MIIKVESWVRGRAWEIFSQASVSGVFGAGIFSLQLLRDGRSAFNCDPFYAAGFIARVAAIVEQNRDSKARALTVREFVDAKNNTLAAHTEVAHFKALVDQACGSGT